MATDDKQPDDAESLEPDPEPAPPPRAERSLRRRDDEDDFDDRDDRDDDYHPRGRKVHYDEDGHEITSDQCMWALFSHIGVLAVGFLAPLIILIVFRQKSPFVVRHARESLNHLITLLFLNMLAVGIGAAIGFGVYAATQEPIAGVIAGELVAFVPTMALAVAHIVYLVIATIAASKYREYRYPFTLRLIG